MKLFDWKALIKAAKYTGRTLDSSQLKAKCDYLEPYTITFAYTPLKPSKWLICGSVDVVFKTKPQRLSVFEAWTLYLLFVENKIPMDYAGYHECKAGQRFIENILEVKP